MATPKFDKISVEVSRRVGDPVVSAPTAGTFMTAAERNAYVSKALMKLFNEVWASVGGNNSAFIELFPELMRDDTITTTPGGEYTPSAGNGDAYFFKIIDGAKSSTYIKALDKVLYRTVKLGVSDLYTPSSTNLFVFEIEGVLKFLPASSFNAQSVDISFIRQPIQSDGNFIVQSSGEDSPFYDQWNSKIAEIAELLIKTDRQYK